MSFADSQIMTAGSPSSSVPFNSGAMNNDDSSDSVLFVEPNGVPINRINSAKPIEYITIDDDDEDQQLAANSEDSALGIEPCDDFPDFDSHSVISDNDLQSAPVNFNSRPPPSLAINALRIQKMEFDDDSSVALLQRMNSTLSGTLSSSVVVSSISAVPETSILPKIITSTNTTNNIVISCNMPTENNNQPALYENHQQEEDHSSGQEIAEEWSQKSDQTALSSYRTKSSSSSSSSASSGCSSDFELVHSPGEGDHNHDHDNHDTSPDSPDSGVSGSVNSSDDLKQMEEEDEEEDEDEHLNLNLEPCAPSVQRNLPSESTFPSPLPPVVHQANLSTRCDLDVNNDDEANAESAALDSIFVEQINSATSAIDTLSIVSQLTATAKSSVIQSHINSNLKPEFVCKWHKCDWPGTYEELADHVHLHVNLQPFLDEHGKVIRWTKPKHKFRSANDEEEDETPCNSELDDDSEVEEDEEMASDDDTQSVSSASSARITRRTRRGLLDYAPNKNSPKLTRQNSQQADLRAGEKQADMQYVCLWKGCRVYGKLSSSKQWLERHVLELHSGPNPFKCIWEGCGQRFKSQNSLERHVNSHFRQGNMICGQAPPCGSSRGLHSKNGNCCCSCTCHACIDCDTEATLPAQRPDKSRCESTDSAISFNSASSADCLPSTSQSLSASTASSSSSTEHCHSACCCKQNTELGANSPFFKNKKKHLRRKRMPAPAQRPCTFDFFGLQAGILALHRFRTAKLSTVGIDSVYRKMERKTNGRFVEIENATVGSSDEESESEDESNQFETYSNESSVASHFEKDDNVVYCLDERLYGIEKYCTFWSEVIIVHKPDDGDVNVRLRWFPIGALDDEWIKETELEANRTRSVPHSKLPKSFLKSLVSRKSVKRSQSIGGGSLHPNKQRKH